MNNTLKRTASLFISDIFKIGWIIKRFSFKIKIWMRNKMNFILFVLSILSFFIFFMFRITKIKIFSIILKNGVIDSILMSMLMIIQLNPRLGYMMEGINSSLFSNKKHPIKNLFLNNISRKYRISKVLNRLLKLFNYSVIKH